MDRPKRRVVLVIFFVGAGCIALNSYLFYQYVLEGYGVMVQSSNLPVEALVAMESELARFWIVLTALTALVLIVLVAWVVLLVHRITGPLVQFAKVFERLKSGEADARIRLRAGDELQDLAKSFNEMIDVVQKAR